MQKKEKKKTTIVLVPTKAIQIQQGCGNTKIDYFQKLEQLGRDAIGCNYDWVDPLQITSRNG